MHTDDRDENLVLFFSSSIDPYVRFWTVASVEQFTLEFAKMGLWPVWKLLKNRYAWGFSLPHIVHQKKKHLTSSSLSVVKLWKSYLQWLEDRMVSLNEPRNGFVRDKRLSLHLVCKTFHLPVYELPFQGWVSPAVTSQACAEQNECP